MAAVKGAQCPFEEPARQVIIILIATYYTNISSGKGQAKVLGGTHTHTHPRPPLQVEGPQRQMERIQVHGEKDSRSFKVVCG
jgi:hypothetical protein